MQHVFRSLHGVLKDLEGGEAGREAVVFAAWRQIAGGPLGQHAVPLRLDKKKLLVAVSNDIWRKQIGDLSAQMIFKLNSILGGSLVTFIEFCVDAKAVESDRSGRAHLQIPVSDLKADALKHVTPRLRRAAESITDERLRHEFLLAAGCSLARTKKDRKL